ncbi:flagellar assembly protein FliH [Pseudalkalibacillus sp. Hm43]|uniref:flagellar assembly protein FliH n=1 Tax=Pseudalkalibacillus sp. Hm43 TaxID=3450742 RepID=UPI003F43A5C5
MSRVIKFSPVIQNSDTKPVEIKRLSAFQSKESSAEQSNHESNLRDKAEHDAEKLLTEARQEAERLVSEAQNEINQKLEELAQKEADLQSYISKAEQEAAEKGYQEGYEQGQKNGEEEYRSLIAEANRILASAQSHHHQKMMECEPELIELSVSVAGKIIGENLDFEDKWKTFISEALNQVKQEEDIKLFVPPKHYTSSVELAKNLSSIFNTEIIVYPDDSKTDLGCVIETKYGQIDASIDSQLEELKEKLLELVGEHNEHHSGSGVT